MEGTGSCVVCLNYKDYDNPEAGVEPWFLTNKVVVIPLLSSAWVSESWEDVLKRGAQEMIDKAASDEFGFKDGDFYGVFWLEVGVRYWSLGHVGFVYASSESPLIPVRGLEEKDLSSRDDSYPLWVTPQFAIPLQVEVQLPCESRVVIPQGSRYMRSPVI